MILFEKRIHDAVKTNQTDVTVNSGNPEMITIGGVAYPVSLVRAMIPALEEAVDKAMAAQIALDKIKKSEFVRHEKG